MLLTIENLFDQILKIVKQKRKANTSFDGKNFWQPIKKILSESSWKASKWRKQSNTKYEKGDHRNNWNPKQIDLWSKSIKLFKKNS